MTVKFANGQTLNESEYCYCENGMLVRAGKVEIGEEAFRAGKSLGKRIS